MIKKRPWTKDEVDYLKSLTKGRSRKEAIAKFQERYSERTSISICSKIKRLKLNERSNFWSEQEVELLYQCVGAYPFRVACNHYRRYAAQFGYQSRTDKAILKKAEKLGISTGIRYAQSLCLANWAEVLGVSVTAVQDWDLRGHIQTKKEGKYRICHPDEIKKLIKRDPWRFKKADLLVIEDLFGEKYADMIEDAPIRYQRRKVYDKTTSRIYPTQAAAREALYLSNSVIQRMLREGDRLTFVGDT